MAAAAPNQRASLLSGLRTGGVRSTSVNVPHTAAPGATFNTTRYASSNYNNNYPQEDEEQELADMVAHKMYFNNGAQPRMQAPPMTAAVDGSFNRFSQQQMRGGQYMNGGVNAMHAQAQAQQQQQQALQMQMMQLEMLRLQTMQAQQYQAELMQAQLQQQQHQQQPTRNYNPPATAGPVATSFGSSQLRRPSQVDSLRHQLGLAHEEQVPQTAALGGKFGGRLVIPADNEFPGSRNAYSGQQTGTPMTPTSYASTNVISGGTSLGNAIGGQVTTPTVMSKSDSATNWRRASTNTSVLRRSPPPAMPDVKVTPPPIDTNTAPASGPQSAFSPVMATPTARNRPTPLRFTPPSSMAATVAVSSEDGHDSEDTGSDRSSNKSGGSPRDDSSPATPQSNGSFAPPLSPREAAAQKLYEGLGLGRPEKAPQTARAAASVPARQPRGPPSGADELGPRNFAQRIRKHAIGGLGALIESRSRSTTPTPVEAY